MTRAGLFCVVAVLGLAAPVDAGPMHIIGACFTVHGRLSLGNGTPSFRIWKIGTGRSLGVFDCEGQGDNVLPASVKRVTGTNFSHEVFADFEVCPLSEEKAGERQRVCIRDAQNLVLGRPTP